MLLSADIRAATLGYSVGDIVCVGSQEKMPWPNACPIVTFMQHVHAVRNRAKFEFIRNAVRVLYFPFDAYMAVAVPAFCGLPRATAVTDKCLIIQSLI